MKLFELFATLALDAGEFVSGIGQSESQFSAFRDKMEGGLSGIGNMMRQLFSADLFGRTGSLFRGMADNVAAAGDRIDKQSQALGMSRQAYQEWDYILAQSGASIDSLGVSMNTLNNAILSDSKETWEAFGQLGLSYGDLAGLTQESAFEKVVRAFQELPEGAEKSALAVKLFGRNGLALLPLLNSEADAIDEMRQRAEELGLIMGDDAIDAAVAYGDALDDMNRTFDAVKYAIGAEFLPVLSNAFSNVATYVGRLLNAYKSGGLKGVFSTIAGDIGGILANINWPTWDDVKDAAGVAWEGIKTGALNIADYFGGLIFGRNEDGTVAMPSVTELVETFSAWWEETAVPAMSDAMVWTLKLFGMPEEDAESIASQISGWWSGIKDQVIAHLGITEIIGAWADISEFTSDIGGLAGSILSLGSSFSSLGESQETSSGFWEFLKDGLTSVTTPASTVRDILFNILSHWRDIKGAVSEAITVVKEFVEAAGIPETIENAINGIANAWNSVTSGIQAAIDKLKEWTGIGNPSNSSWRDAAKNLPVSPATRMESFAQTYLDGSSTSGAVDNAGKFAVGLDYVPYDDFPAYLHEGEAVLTKTEARDWRNGETVQQGIDTPLIAQAVASAVREGMQGFGFFVDGQRIADAVSEPVSRNISNLAWAGRYQ